MATNDSFVISRINICNKIYVIIGCIYSIITISIFIKNMCWYHVPSGLIRVVVIARM